jgi:hypothetical protein
VVLLRVANAGDLPTSQISLGLWTVFFVLVLCVKLLAGVESHPEELLSGHWVPDVHCFLVASGEAMSVWIENNVLGHLLVTEVRGVNAVAEFKSKIICLLMP